MSGHDPIALLLAGSFTVLAVSLAWDTGTIGVSIAAFIGWLTGYNLGNLASPLEVEAK